MLFGMPESPPPEGPPPDQIANFLRRIGAALGGSSAPQEGVESAPDQEEPHIRLETTRGFEPYREQMRTIDALLDQGVAPESIPGYLATGGICHVFETTGGKILRLPRIELLETEHEEDEPPEQVGDYLLPVRIRTDYILPLERTKGEEGFEQLVGATEEDGGGIASERAPGKPLAELTADEMDAIPLADFESLMRHCRRAAELGVTPSYKPEDIFHAMDRGFTFTDCSLHAEPDVRLQEPADFAIAFANLFEIDRGRIPGPAAANYFAAFAAAFDEPALDRLRWVWHMKEFPFPEGYTSPTEVALPKNIRTLLGARAFERTAPSGVREFALPGNPAVIIRPLRVGAPSALADIKQATDRLTRQHVPVVPWSLVTVGQYPYAVAQRVEGRGIEEILALRQDENAAGAIDTVLAGVGANLAESHRKRWPVAEGAADLSRYTWGALSGQQAPKIWLTDVPDRTFAPPRPDAYASELLQLANSIVRAEGLTGRTLQEARSKARQAAHGSAASSRFGRAITRAILHVLDTGEIVPISKGSGSFEEITQRFGDEE
jgi:hypothetical protein